MKKLLGLVFLFTLLLVISAVANAEDKICRYCNQPMTYVQTIEGFGCQYSCVLDNELITVNHGSSSNQCYFTKAEDSENHYVKCKYCGEELKSEAHSFEHKEAEDKPATESAAKQECWKCVCGEIDWRSVGSPLASKATVNKVTFNATGSGLPLSEFGYTGLNKWRMVTPIDTAEASELPLIGGNQYIIGKLILTPVEGGLKVDIENENYAALEDGYCYYLIPAEVAVDYSSIPGSNFSSLPEEYKHFYGETVEASGVMLFFPDITVTVNQKYNTSEWFNFKSEEYIGFCESLRAMIADNQ